MKSFDDEIRNLVGTSVRGSALGVGSFVTIEFGGMRRSSVGLLRGDYHLWIYGAAWRIARHERVLATSDDEPVRMAAAISTLDGAIVTDAIYEPADLGLVIEFGHTTRFSTAATDDPEMEHWMLYLPDGSVIVAGPGDTIGRERADRSEPLPAQPDGL